MQGLFDFIVTPKYSRSTSITKVEGKDLILNTEMQNHQYVSRHGVVVSIPCNLKTNVKPGDEVILHHNVFRRFYDIRGKERNGRSFFEEDKFLVREDQIFLHKVNKKWQPLDGYCFVKPLLNQDDFLAETEEPLKGILKYKDKCLTDLGLSIGDLVGFTPGSEYEFVINKEKLYRVPSNKITIKYEYKGNEKEYNPSWTQSS